MVRFWLPAFLLLSLSAQAVLNGSLDREDDYPVVVGIAKKEPDTRWRVSCSGIAIHPRAVLTAGHCVRDDSAKDLGVYLGQGAAAGIVPGSDVRVVLDVKVKKEYLGGTKFSDHDIAIVTTAEEMPEDAIFGYGTKGDCVLDIAEFIQASEKHSTYEIAGFGNSTGEEFPHQVEDLDQGFRRFGVAPLEALPAMYFEYSEGAKVFELEYGTDLYTLILSLHGLHKGETNNLNLHPARNFLWEAAEPITLIFQESVPGGRDAIGVVGGDSGGPLFLKRNEERCLAGINVRSLLHGKTKTWGSVVSLPLGYHSEFIEGALEEHHSSSSSIPSPDK